MRRLDPLTTGAAVAVLIAGTPGLASSVTAAARWGAALACTLALHIVVRIVLTPLLGFFMVISELGLGILAVTYTLTVAAWWWGYKTWTLFYAGRAAPVG